MSDETTTPKAENATAPVVFTEREHRDLVQAVGAAVSAALGGIPVAVGFDAEKATFLVEVTGTVPEVAKN